MSDDNPTADSIAVEDEDSSSAIEKNLKSGTTWLRLVFMLVACVLISLASFVGAAVVVLGFLSVLFTGKKNHQLQHLGKSLGLYIYQICLYLTFNSETKPFPFGADWPSAESE